MYNENHPELSGHDTDRPLRSNRRQARLRLMVLLVVFAMVVPGVLSMVSMASATAQRACAATVQQLAPSATGFNATFEWFGPSFVGWECYAQDVVGGQTHVASLGLIPSIPSR